MVVSTILHREDGVCFPQPPEQRITNRSPQTLPPREPALEATCHRCHRPALVVTRPLRLFAFLSYCCHFPLCVLTAVRTVSKSPPCHTPLRSVPTAVRMSRPTPGSAARAASPSCVTQLAPIAARRYQRPCISAKRAASRLPRSLYHTARFNRAPYPCKRHNHLSCLCVQRHYLLNPSQQLQKPARERDVHARQ